MSVSWCEARPWSRISWVFHIHYFIIYGMIMKIFMNDVTTYTIFISSIYCYVAWHNVKSQGELSSCTAGLLCPHDVPSGPISLYTLHIIDLNLCRKSCDLVTKSNPLKSFGLVPRWLVAYGGGGGGGREGGGRGSWGTIKEYTAKFASCRITRLMSSLYYVCWVTRTVIVNKYWLQCVRGATSEKKLPSTITTSWNSENIATQIYDISYTCYSIIIP